MCWCDNFCGAQKADEIGVKCQCDNISSYDAKGDGLTCSRISWAALSAKENKNTTN